MDIIYQITDTITKLKYIGSKKSWQGHGTYFGSPNCKSKRFKKYEMQLSWKEALITRPDTFEFSVLEFYDCVEHEFLLERELWWQKKFDVVKSFEFVNVGFAKKGFCGDIYAQMTPEEIEKTKTKMSNSLTIHMTNLSEEARKEIYGQPGETNGNFGNRWNDEQRKNMSIRMKEQFKTKPCYKKGKTHKELYGEEKAKIFSETLSKSSSNRIAEKNPFFGKHHNEESKEKIRTKNKGKKPVNTKKIQIDDKVYEGLTEASVATGIKPTTIWHRIHSKNPKYNKYCYIEPII